MFPAPAEFAVVLYLSPGEDCLSLSGSAKGPVKNRSVDSLDVRVLGFLAPSRGFDNPTAILTAATGKSTTAAAAIAAAQTAPVRTFFMIHPPLVHACPWTDSGTPRPRIFQD